ncbi:MAG: orotidine-5'-phosphate decarboxylase [Fimbriimonadaceae bacterium]|nr:orotidine-5'-phosphate decarboxylase [Fimbriimonadaceae bacterium]QYK55091.1 MAG: orotidine-5'-phosphate decarboxylase [Fimbriimonadaceae bacterium]
MNLKRKLVCALDMSDIDVAMDAVRRISPYVGAFKVGHALALPYGLDVIERLREAGAERIFLDLKFHDIPNSVALGVREAAKRGVWMATLHLSGGRAMITAAIEEAQAYAADEAPLLIGVSVLTSLDQECLSHDLGVSRSLHEHMVCLSKMGVENGLDGVVCSAQEISQIRPEIGSHAVIVTPGIRPANYERHDQQRVGDAVSALKDGADYLVIGRVLTNAADPHQAMLDLGLLQDEYVG